MPCPPCCCCASHACDCDTEFALKRWGRALLAQGLAWLLAIWLLSTLSPGARGSLAEALLAAMMAAALSLALREPRWRAPMQAAFSLAVWVGVTA